MKLQGGSVTQDVYNEASPDTMPVIHPTCLYGSQIWPAPLSEASLGIIYYV
jgi:hypothetical protein